MTNPVDVPAYGAPPTAPDPNNRPTYNALRAAMNFWMLGINSPTGSNMAGLAQSASTNATSASESAIAAAAAAAGANVELWDAVTVYSVGVVVISPAALAAGAASVTYVCKVATGSTHIDPYSDPTHWAIFTVSGGTGGAVYTTSTTLTSSSPFAISISGGAGVWLKLPDATTLSTGIRHAVRNTGDNDLTVLDSTGLVIGFIRPQCGTTIALSDSSTAAGKWVGDFEQIGVTADFQFGGTVAGLQNVKQIIQLDEVRMMVIAGGSNGQGLWAIVYETATQTAGAPVMIRAAAWGAMAVKSATDQVLCVAWDNGNPGNLYATVLTVSGTSVTVNTAVTAAITGQFTGAGNWVAVGGAFCLSYNNGSYGVARAITISGTTPSIGAEQSAAASGAPRLYASGSILRAVRVSSASTIVCTPYTASGNTLTAGTLASTATTLADAAVRTLQDSNGDIIALHTNGGYYCASIFHLSATAEAVNSGNIRSHGTLAVSSIDLNKSDYSICDAARILFGCTLNSDYSVFSVNHVTNNNGVPLIGTAVDFANTVNASGVIEVVSSNFERGFVVSSAYPTYSPASVCNLMLFDTSSASPVRTKVFNLSDKIPSNSLLPYNLPKSVIGNYHSQLCVNSKGIFNITSLNGIVINTSPATKFFTNAASAYLLGSSGAQIPYKTQPLFRAAGSVRGENNQTTWAVMPLTTVAESSLGVALQRIQIAQV